MVTEDKEELIAKYERLRGKLDDLYVQAEHIDRGLIEIEKRLPEDYVYPGYTPQI